MGILKYILIGVVVGFAAGDSRAAWYTAPFGPDGTWNVYQVFWNRTTWVRANRQAVSREHDGTPGHLVAIGSLEENSFVSRIAPFESWMGLTDHPGTGVAGATETGSDAELSPWGGWDGELAAIPELVRPDVNLDSGWAWVTGEPFVFSYWEEGEPNNWHEGEGGVMQRLDGSWNDAGIGIRPEIPPQPTTLNGYVVEFETNSPNPVKHNSVIIPPDDYFPPVIRDVVVGDSIVDIARGSREASITWNITDDFSGLDSLRVTYLSEDGRHRTQGVFSVDSNGGREYETRLRFKRNAPAAKWLLKSVVVSDASGNSQDYRAIDFAMMGIDNLGITTRHLQEGDANQDGLINFDDAFVLASNFETISGNATWTDGDFNADGFVDFADAFILSANYETIAAATVPIPEPSSLLLVLIGMSCFIIVSKYASHLAAM